MTKNEMEPLRDQLLKLKRDLQSDVDALAGEAFQSADGKSMGSLSNFAANDRAERGSDSYDKEVTIGLLEKEECT